MLTLSVIIYLGHLLVLYPVIPTQLSKAEVPNWWSMDP